MLQICEYQGQSEEDGHTYTDEHGIVRCKHDRDIMGSCIACVEEERQGLPPCYAVYKADEGWFWLWKNPDPRVEETWSDGPYDDKEDCRWESWDDFENRAMSGELDEQGRKVEARRPPDHA
jgi:hypothetical protein